MKTILVDAVKVFVDMDGSINDEMHQLLEEYPNKKIVLTNADYEKTNKFGLNDMPYEVFTLKHNPNKIDPQYYKKMLSHYNFDTDNVVYFEHNSKAVESAKSVGITTHHYDEGKKDLKSLKKFLDKNL